MPELAGRVADAFESLVREHEERWLSPLAVRSYESRGRAHEEEECRLRTPFQRDRDRIVHSKAFRRLKHKTQVFIDPNGDHYRTRLTHTLETTGISRGVARALRLNEDLAEAIGLGHDLGHPAFGHAFALVGGLARYAIGLKKRRSSDRHLPRHVPPFLDECLSVGQGDFGKDLPAIDLHRCLRYGPILCQERRRGKLRRSAHDRPPNTPVKYAPVTSQSSFCASRGRRGGAFAAPVGGAADY